MRRRIHHSIALDQSLRQSRSIWLALAIVLAPIAGLMASAILASDGGLADRIFGPYALVISLVFAIALILLVFVAFSRVFEANRRLKRLREDPSANVRPLPAPFQSSLFGPYH